MTPAGARTDAGRRDPILAAAVGLIAFGVYVATLAPGLVDVIDTPMFQFVGRVLGVAHNPGYPLFVLLTHPFSFLPIGSLAYRINLFSALFGAITVALVYLVARRLGCRPLVSAAAALGLAFGQIVWSQAVIAEVYTLDTAFVAAVFLTALAWGESGGRRTWLFFTAVALLGIGFGNHTTILGFLPGLLAYAWFVHRPTVTRVRPLLVTAALFGAGLLQYGFILLRSRDPTAFLESRATTVGELVETIGGHQWWGRLFELGWREVLAERVPWLVGQVLVPELTTVGLVIAGVGAVRLIAARRAEALLLLIGWIACVGFALNYSAVDLPVFLIPAMLVCWLVLGVGAEWLMTRIRPAAGQVAMGLIVVAMPAWLFVQNYARVDQSRNTTAAIALDRLFDALPDRSAIVREDFLIDRMVLYKVLGDPPADHRAMAALSVGDAIQREQRGEGRTFAFAGSAEQLRLEGLDVGYEPVALLEDDLPTVIARLPAEQVVAIAVPASAREAFVASGASVLSAIGAPDGLRRTADGGLTIVGVTGGRVAVAPLGPGPAGCVAYDAGRLATTGVTVPATITLAATATEAAIRVGDRDVIRTSEGAAMAIWDADGQRVRTTVLQAVDGFRVPMAIGPLSAYPVLGLSAVNEVGPAWTSVPAAGRTGSVLFRVPDDATLEAYAVATGPLAPRVIDSTRGVGPTSISEVSAEHVRGAFEALRSVTGGSFYRIAVTGPGSVIVSLGGVPADLVARMDGDGIGRLSALDTSGLLRAPDRITGVLGMARDDQAQLLGPGWSDAEADDVGPLRWVVGDRASLLLPTTDDRPRRIRIQARLAPTVEHLAVRVSLDGRDLGTRGLERGWQRYEWTVPAGAAAARTNVLALTIEDDGTGASSDPSARRLAVSDVRAVYDEGASVEPPSALPPCS